MKLFSYAVLCLTCVGLLYWGASSLELIGNNTQEQLSSNFSVTGDNKLNNDFPLYDYKKSNESFEVFVGEAEELVYQIKSGDIYEEAIPCDKGKSVYIDGDYSTIKVLSLVGPYLSIELSRSWDGGAHPGAYTEWKILDLRDPEKELRLDMLFSEEEILKAFLKNPVVIAAHPEKQPATISELVQNWVRTGDDVCKYEVAEDLLKRAAFFDVDEEGVVVRFGLSHGCELERGNLTQLEIKIPTPDNLKVAFTKAKNGNSSFLASSTSSWKAYETQEYLASCN